MYENKYYIIDAPILPFSQNYVIIYERAHNEKIIPARIPKLHAFKNKRKNERKYTSFSSQLKSKNYLLTREKNRRPTQKIHRSYAITDKILFVSEAPKLSRPETTTIFLDVRDRIRNVLYKRATRESLTIHARTTNLNFDLPASVTSLQPLLLLHKVAKEIPMWSTTAYEMVSASVYDHTYIVNVDRYVYDIRIQM